MRLRVDPYRGVAQDRELFAMRVLDQGQIFKGWLEIPDEAGEIPETAELRLGAKTTVGLGRATVRFERAGVSASGDLQERIARFQEKARNGLKQSDKGETEECTYFALTLLVDALPEKTLAAKSEWVPTATLQQEVAQAILPSGSPIVARDVEAVKVITDFKVYGSYCTAERRDGRQEAALHIAAGSVFLYRMRSVLDDEMLQSLRRLEEQGVGAKTEDGYGAVRVCDEFHLNTGGMTGGC
jgi:CRISPR-associated protein Csx10